MKTCSLTAITALALAAGAASASTYSWDWNASTGPSGASINNCAGAFESIHTTYNSQTNQLVYNAVFSNRDTRAFTLAINNGNPCPGIGELGVIYFDGTNVCNPRLTAYAFNGQSLTNSWRDGNGAAWGHPAGDNIENLCDTSWIQSASVVDLPNCKRGFNLTVDVGGINSHVPDFQGDRDWFGMGFDNCIGLWMHTYSSICPSYNQSGQLCSWNACGEGWFEGNWCNQPPVIVPLPAGAWAGLAGLGITGVALRRRKAKQQ